MLLVMLLAGCGSPDPPPPPPERCGSASWQAARRALLDGLQLPPSAAGPPQASLSASETLDGWSIQPLTWAHPGVDGDVVFGAAYLPDPVPPGALPLLVNVHGHWGGGIEADEVNRRAILFAQQGWIVLSVANRGEEHGADTPGWRRSHGRPAGYALARTRRSGGAGLTWDIAAARAGLDLALTGKLGATVDRERIATIGFSGGAERAAVLAAVDPRIAAVVLGAYEYAFSSGHGAAGCSCGTVRGAAEPLTDHALSGREVAESPTGYTAPVQGARWLALAGCRPGSPVTARPILLWDSFPDDVVDVEAVALPKADRRGAVGVHGITVEMAASSWSWLEQALGRTPGVSAKAAAKRADEGYSVIHPRWRPALPETLPAPGQMEQGPPPWRADPGVHPEALMRLLALDDAGARLGTHGIAEHAAVEVFAPVGAGLTTRARAGWLVVTAGTPGPVAPGFDEHGDLPWIDGGAQLAAVGGLGALRDLAPDAVFALVDLRVGRTAEADVAASGWGAELGVPPLGVAVRDVLDAHDRLRAHPEVDPAQVGFVAIGPGGVAALQAAVLIGEGGPVALVAAPVTLWFDGPDGGPPFFPWPSWTIAPVPGGATLDPWPAAAALGDRVRWLDPRAGDGQPWTDPLPGGGLATGLAGLLKETR